MAESCNKTRLLQQLKSEPGGEGVGSHAHKLEQQVRGQHPDAGCGMPLPAPPAAAGATAATRGMRSKQQGLHGLAEAGGEGGMNGWLPRWSLHHQAHQWPAATKEGRAAFNSAYTQQDNAVRETGCANALTCQDTGEPSRPCRWGVAGSQLTAGFQPSELHGSLPPAAK